MCYNYYNNMNKIYVSILGFTNVISALAYVYLSNKYDYVKEELIILNDKEKYLRIENLKLSKDIKTLVEKIQNNDTNVDEFVEEIYCKKCIALPTACFLHTNTVCKTCKRCHICNSRYYKNEIVNPTERIIYS